jgi:hypothetical protein
MQWKMEEGSSGDIGALAKGPSSAWDGHAWLYRSFINLHRNLQGIFDSGQGNISIKDCPVFDIPP